MNKFKRLTDHTWRIYKVTDGTKTYVGLTSQKLLTRLAQHKKAARDMRDGVASRTKRHFAYTRQFYEDLLHGTWRIVLLEQVKGDHKRALRIERRMKKKHETYKGFSQLDR